jgi:hypothetical protein
MTSLELAEDKLGDRQILWADFDAMLANMAQELGRTAAFFGFAASDEQLAQIAAGPLMGRYSKDPQYDYSANLRQQLIEQELRLKGRDIEAALAMLRTASEKSPIVARALRRAEGN